MPSRPAAKQRFSFQELFAQDNLPLMATLALLCGVLIRLFVHSEAIRDSIGSLFDALFIAAFLAYVVDPVLKQGLLKEGIKNIFPYLYGYSLPKELQNFYDATIVGTKVIRRDCRLHWHISEARDTPERVALQLHASFNIVNFTDEERIYNHEVFATSDTPGEHGSVEVLYCKDLELDKYRYELKRGEFIEVKKAGVTKRGYWTGQPIPLEAETTQQKSRYQFGVHYYSESSATYGVDTFRVSEVTTDIGIVITVDPHLKDHYFSVIPSPATDAEGMTPFLDTQTQEYRCCWRFPRLFAPNETLVIRWQAVEPLSDTTNPGL